MMKKLFIGTITLSLAFIFGQTISAQAVSNNAAVKKPVKDLKKSLSKNSRFGNEVIYWFKPIKFEGCQVSFRFARLGETGLENFSNVSFDKSTGVYRNNTVRNQDLPIMSTAQTQNLRENPAVNNNGNSRLSSVNGRSSSFNYNSYPYYFYGLSNRVGLMATFVTGIDLSVVDADKIRVEKNENGQYFIVIESLKDKTAVLKGNINAVNQVNRIDRDIIPVTSEKGGNKIAEKFVGAVKACQS